MKLFSFCIFLFVALPGFSQQIPERAVCSVCAIQHGESQPEKVKAWSDYKETRYYFCSDNCKKEFDADPEGFLPPVLPRPASAFAVESLTGETLTKESLKGKWVLIDFWATWCKPCEKMMPDLHKLHADFSNRNFAVIGISIDEGKDAYQKVKKFVEKRKIGYPIYLDVKETPAWAAFRVKAIPAMFLMNPSGEIVAEWRGEVKYESVRLDVTFHLNK